MKLFGGKIGNESSVPLCIVHLLVKQLAKACCLAMSSVGVSLKSWAAKRGAYLFSLMNVDYCVIAGRRDCFHAALSCPSICIELAGLFVSRY
jgi:hypothetical protein